MSLLDDARRLVAWEKPAGHPWRECFHPTTQAGGEGCHSFASCHAVWPERCQFSHLDHFEEDDPRLSLPKILAALEVAERIAADMPQEEGWDICYYCGGWREHHDGDCPWQALVAALKGEEVTA